MEKIIDYKKLPTLIELIKQENKPLVLVGGCFDILHFGHVRFLAQAKKSGTVIVAVESDENLTKYKGVFRPIHKQPERAEVLASLENVDYVIPLPQFTTHQEYFDLVQMIRPDIIAVTEGDAQMENKQKQAESVGGKIAVIAKIKTPSTTQLAKLLRLDFD